MSVLTNPNTTQPKNKGMYILPFDHNRCEELDSSFKHALFIQQAVFGLPDIFVKRIGFEAFFLFEPKDMVSGDFYWTLQIADTTIIIIGDCTGHGMPGAFLSLFAQSACARAVAESRLVHPVDILEKINQVFNTSFEYDNKTHCLGMDLSVCCINKSKMVMECAGAGNPVWMVRGNQLFELKGGRCSIGQFTQLPFINSYTVQLQKNDMIYLFTDGYENQFGNDLTSGRPGKYMKKRLRTAITEISSLDVTAQQKYLWCILENWKKQLEQTDDISLLGLKI
jgi:serine phosphatase RsbU (regulator of sigma subunit)